MESPPPSHCSATPLRAAYVSGRNLPAPWVRLAVAFSNNTQLGHFESHQPGTLSGVVKYSMHDLELWPLDP